jgi:ketosteroid isomerase-like protein
VCPAAALARLAFDGHEPQLLAADHLARADDRRIFFPAAAVARVGLKGRVLAILREIGRGRASGLEVEGRWGYVVTVRDGKIERVEAYRDPRAALDAAGVSEREIQEAAS